LVVLLGWAASAAETVRISRPANPYDRITTNTGCILTPTANAKGELRWLDIRCPGRSTYVYVWWDLPVPAGMTRTAVGYTGPCYRFCAWVHATYYPDEGWAGMYVPPLGHVLVKRVWIEASEG
jgi:hypothetical protein